MWQNLAGTSLHSELTTTQSKVYFIYSFIPSACLCLFFFTSFYFNITPYPSLFLCAICVIYIISSYFLLGMGNANVLVNHRTKFKVKRTSVYWQDALPRRDSCLYSLSIRFLRINVNRQAVSKRYSNSEYRPFCRVPWSRHDNSETNSSISVLCRSLGRYIFVIGGLLIYEACLRITKCTHHGRERGVSRQDVGGFPHVWQNQMRVSEYI
jgi:hypothetical protein